MRKRVINVLMLTIFNYNLAYAIPPICPTVDMIKHARLNENTHDNYATWNLSTVGSFGTLDSWKILVGNIKASDLTKASVVAQEALSNIDKVSGPFLVEYYWVCKYSAAHVNDYYVVAWNLQPQSLS